MFCSRHVANRQIDITSDNDEFIVALKKDGTLWAWGQDRNKFFWNEELKKQPLKISQSNNWRFVRQVNSKIFAIKSDGTLWSWNSYSNKKMAEPFQFGKDANWKEVLGGIGYYYGLKTNVTLWARGNNN